MAEVLGPRWADHGLSQQAGRYPLAVEGPVFRAVEALVPGVSTVTRYIRYYAFYAAFAQYAATKGLDAEGCQRLLRRSEVVFAAAHLAVSAENANGTAHGVDGVRAFCGDVVDVAQAADLRERGKSYSPRQWGFWAQYGGPSAVLGTVTLENGALRPGRHQCPPEVYELFEPVFSLAGRDSVPIGELAALDRVVLHSEYRPEITWMAGIFTATQGNQHDPERWEPDDRTRRATLRVLGRAVQLHGMSEHSFEEMLRSAVAFGGQIETDPVLSSIEQSQGWRGVLLRHYSVGAWRRLWAALVRSIGREGDDADRSRDELRAWLADLLPSTSVGRALDDLMPLHDGAGHPVPRERQLLQKGDRADQLVNVQLLLIGGRRSQELRGVARKIFLGSRRRKREVGEILDPTWVYYLTQEYRDRPLKDLGARLVDDMLAQAIRVARAKMRRDPATGRLQMFSRVHERNDRFFKTGDEGDGDIGLRVRELGDFSVQVNLVRPRAGGWEVTPEAQTLLELAT